MPDSTKPVFHVALASDWASAASAGEYGWSTRGLHIDDVGFMHACFAEQIQGVFEHFYADVAGDLLLLELDIPHLESRGMKLLVEPLDPDDPASEAFPHLYGGMLPVEGVSRVQPFRG